MIKLKLLGPGMTIIGLILSLLFLPVLGLSSETKSDTSVVPSFSDSALRLKIGQLFIIGMPGTELGVETKKYLTDYPFGNFVFFKRNIISPNQTRLFTDSIQNFLADQKRPLALIGIDQEGGLVSRIPTQPTLPSVQSIGEFNSSGAVETFGTSTGKILSSSGFNINFAPVLDLGGIDKNSFIASRSYSEDPAEVQIFAWEYSKGLIANTIVPTAKHFPGSYGVPVDPHVMNFTVKKTIEQLKQKELFPFTRFAQLGRFSAVMMSHFHYTAFDSEIIPASLSKNAMGYLRNELLFKGIIITDDLQMAGAKNLYSPAEASFRSLKAGADLVMLAYSQKDQIASFERVLQAVQSGEISEQSIDEKISRISFIKSYLAKAKRSAPNWQDSDLAKLDQLIVDSRLKEMRMPSALPKKVCYLETKHKIGKGFSAELKKRGISAEVITNKSSISQMQLCSYTFYFIYDQRSASAYASVSQEFDSSKKIGINIGSPHLVANIRDKSVVNLLFPHSSVPKKLADLIARSANINSL